MDPMNDNEEIAREILEILRGIDGSGDDGLNLLETGEIARLLEGELS